MKNILFILFLIPILSLKGIDFLEAIRFNSDFILFEDMKQAYVQIPSSRCDFKSSTQDDKKNITIEPNLNATVPHGAFLWPQAVRPPFAVKAKIKPVDVNVRFLLLGGELIFNWELNRSELRFDLPPQSHSISGAGILTTGQWNNVEIYVTKTEVTVIVNKDVRCQVKGEFNRESYIGLYSTFGGKFTLADLNVVSSR